MVIKDSASAFSATPVVQWIGAHNENICVPYLQRKDIYFYERCIFEEHTLSVGDYVLVQNADSVEPDTISGCDIGRILHMYELHDMSNRDPYRAIVQWYSWPNRIPEKAYDDDNIAIDFELEVIEEHRPYDFDISIETIHKKCTVIHGSVDNTAAELIKKYQGKNRNRLMFVCRFKFIKDKKRSYRLVPLEFSNFESVDVDNRSATASKENGKRKTCYGNIESITSKSGGSESAKKSKRSATFATEKRRRASVATASAVEFVDINKISNENKVSPIKIIGGRSIVRLSASEKKQKSRNSQKEMSSNYLMASPLAEQNIKVTPTSRIAAARRNLNLSLDNGADSTADSDCLNYSIVDSNISGPQSSENDIKIKLRLSEKKQQSRLASVIEDPLAFDDVENTSVPLQRKRLGTVANGTSNNSDIYNTPTKRSKDVHHVGGSEMTPSATRRKSILKSASRRLDDGTPRRSIQLSNIVEKRVFNEDDIILTPTRGRSRKNLNIAIDDDNHTPKKTIEKTPTRGRRSSVKQTSATKTSPMTPTVKLKLIRSGEITPSIEARCENSSGINKRKSDLQLARERLHVSVVPQSLPCREKEFDNIYTFLEGKIEDQCGGCMYVSGVPGTGKTATVTGVIRSLKLEAAEDKLPEFEFLEINGMRLTEPRQAYVQIYKQLTGKTVTWEQAHALLEKRFTTPAPRRITTVLLVDELDILCNRRQDVVYNLLDWPTKAAARLVVVTIANTMDLPERLLMGKVTSRLGLTRLTFQPYTHKQLQDIVTARLGGSEAFKGDAVQLVARKVAAVSGDARRALDICRRATEIAEFSKNSDKFVNMLHVQQALAEMIASAKVQAIKNCSRIEQLFLQAVAAEVTRTGVEETSFMGVYSQIESIAPFMGITIPAPGRTLRVCSKLGAERLLICEHSRNDIFQKILLNVNMDDIHYALKVNANGT